MTTLPTVQQCVCNGPGKCALFKKDMTARHWQICSGKFDSNLPVVSEATRAAYIDRWSAAAGLFKGDGQPSQKKPKKVGGPGTELKALISSLGLDELHGCGCNSLAKKMDRIGSEACRNEKDKIVERLREAQEALTWRETLRASKNAVLTGLAFKLNPLDPAPGLVDEAIRRAEVKDQEKAP